MCRGGGGRVNTGALKPAVLEPLKLESDTGAGAELCSSGRAASALSHWAISSPQICILADITYFSYFIVSNAFLLVPNRSPFSGPSLASAP